jgi:hypothetical protein
VLLSKRGPGNRLALPFLLSISIFGFTIVLPHDARSYVNPGGAAVAIPLMITVWILLTVTL